MNINQLNYFLAVAESGSFTQAAQICAIAQPSISQQIKALERHVNTTLFDRLPRRAVLTDAGQRFLPYARKLITDANDARRAAQDSTKQITGNLHIGVIPTIAPYLLPNVTAEFIKQNPHVNLNFDEDTTTALLQKLHAGSLDLVIASTPIPPEQLHVETLRDEPLVTAIPRQHKLAERKSITWKHLADEPFMLLHDMHCLSRQIVDFSTRQNLHANIIFRGASLATIAQLVNKSIGISLIPQMAVEHLRQRNITFKPFSKSPPSRTITAVWHLYRYRTNASREFLKHLKNEMNTST